MMGIVRIGKVKFGSPGRESMGTKICIACQIEDHSLCLCEPECGCACQEDEDDGN